MSYADRVDNIFLFIHVVFSLSKASKGRGYIYFLNQIERIRFWLHPKDVDNHLNISIQRG